MIDVKTDSTWNGDIVKGLAFNAATGSAYEIGLAVEAQAKLLADGFKHPTGRTKGSITTQARDKGTSPSGTGSAGSDVIQKPSDAQEVFVGTAVNYAPYLEFGTMYMRAQPFLRPALQIVTGGAIQIAEFESKKEFGGFLQ